MFLQNFEFTVLDEVNSVGQGASLLVNTVASFETFLFHEVGYFLDRAVSQLGEQAELFEESYFFFHFLFLGRLEYLVVCFV